jgi:sugar porter (SP) family MFS transporter
MQGANKMQQMYSHHLSHIHPYLVYFIGACGGLLFGLDSELTGSIMTPARYYLQFGAGTEVVMANAVTFGAGIVALFAGILSDRFGRKKMLLLDGVVFLAGAFLCTIAPNGVVLACSRVILGGGIGIASAIVPSYLAELAPAANRSTVATLFQFAVVIGIGFAAIIGYLLLPAKDFLWMPFNFQIMCFVVMIPALVLFLARFYMPESPRFLVEHGKPEEAARVLQAMRKSDRAGIEQELEDIKSVATQERGGYRELFKVAKRPLLIAVGIAFFQQLVGINAAMYYGPVIGASVMPSPYVGAVLGSAQWIENLQFNQLFNMLFDLVNILATIACVIWMRRIRSYKRCLIGGAALMGLFSVLFVVQVTLHLLPEIAAIVMVCLFICAFAFTWGPITWNILGEIFPLQVRGVGSSFGAAVNWLSNFVVMSVFGIIIDKQVSGGALHIEYGFMMFAAGAVLAILFVYFFVPETKDRSLEQIEKDLRHKLRG